MEDNNNNTPSWWENNEDNDNLDANEEISEEIEEIEEVEEEIVEEIVEEIIEEITEEVEEEIIEEAPIAEAVSSNEHFDCVVLGSDRSLVNAVANGLNNLGKTTKILSSHEDLTRSDGGRPIINCGDGQEAFVKAAEVNDGSSALVIQIGTTMHSGCGLGFSTGVENVIYKTNDFKDLVAKRAIEYVV